MLAELLRSLFGAGRGGGVRILPPLERPRPKARPLAPHHRRAAQVREAIASAPPGLSSRELIGYVRERTGEGCSPKLLARLRRGGAPLLLCALALAGCSWPGRAERTLNVVPSPAPSTIPTGPEPAKPADHPRLVKVRLTLTSPAELRVKTGEEVAAGAALCDRAREREQLLRQRDRLALSLRRLESQAASAAESARIIEGLAAPAPPPEYAAERALVHRAEAEEAAAGRRLEAQRRRLADLLEALPASLPDGADRQAVEEHERARLALAEEARRHSEAESALARARLRGAREARQIEERRHQAEVARQALAARSQLQQLEAARAQIAAQLATIETQVGQLAAVRAPFAGRVERVTWEEQHDQTITVVLYLAVTGR